MVGASISAILGSEAKSAVVILNPMHDLLSELRGACAAVAGRARYVSIHRDAIEPFAASLPTVSDPAPPDPEVHLVEGTREELAAFWLTLDAINFGSGWFPTLRKRPGRSGYFTVASGVTARFRTRGPWAADRLAEIEAAEVAAALGQDPAHELMELFARSLRDLGAHVAGNYAGHFAAVADRAGSSAVELVGALARWRCFEDTSRYEGIPVPFLKRAQIAAADLSLAGIASFDDLDRLTMFADNLVPHVLRLDGVLTFAPLLVERIERGELVEHGSPEEVEIRACAVHAVELIAAARPELTAAALDRLLWQRGQGPRYKSRARHRSRCTAY
jgi:hypothetical protein